MKYVHGDVINGFEYLPPEKRKTILLMSDDARMSSGVATVSREIIVGTAHHFNWCQIAGAIKHPEVGKRVDISQAVDEEMNLVDSKVIIYPFDGYGNIDFVRWIMDNEKVDALLPFTDPRFWGWLFNHEHEIRQRIPIFFYHVWDDLPFPRYNEPYYESCDWIGCISKQTYNIVRQVWKKFPPQPWQISYIPHGIPERLFYPVTEDNVGRTHEITTGAKVKNEKGEEVDETVKKTDYEIMLDLRKQFFGDNDPEFVLLYVNRNVRRKMTSDVILAYNKFCNELPKEKAEKCALLMHTAPVDEAGTNLLAVINDLGIKHRIIISDKRIEPRFMNLIFNIADVTINLASNEGFGLGTAESLMVGTPIIVNVTGGLQDQCGFVNGEGKLLTVEDFNESFGSNHEGLYQVHGDWVKPVFPATLSLQGSVPTPYIFDDRVRWQDVASLIAEWYWMGREERKQHGLNGRNFVLKQEVGMSANEMSRRFMQDMNNAFANWQQKKRFTLYKA